MRVFLHCCCALAILLTAISKTSSSQCYDKDGQPRLCIPTMINAAVGKDIAANNTCGISGPQLYCRKAGFSRRHRYSTCEICYFLERIKNHPASLMIDRGGYGMSTWWQSETLLENENPVQITLNFGKTFNLLYIRIRFQSSRPHSLAIYKKTTTSPNDTWIPYQYYSRSCEETYGVPNSRRSNGFRQDVALCTDRFSDIFPLRGGIVSFTTLEGRSGGFGLDSSPELQDWMTAAAIRIDLDKMNTFGDEVFRDPMVLRSYYFAISDIAVGGRCKCNGHASDCFDKQEVGKERRLVCNCKHNTAGDDCEKCMPLYNDKPWARAKPDDAYPCARCECNDLADECVFDEELYRSRGRGGRCINCRNNTDGINCERCRLSYHRPIKLEACRPCSCNPTGSRSLQCDDNGRCICRPGVTGDKCDRCVPGYYGFSRRGCRPKLATTTSKPSQRIQLNASVSVQV